MPSLDFKSWHVSIKSLKLLELHERITNNITNTVTIVISTVKFSSFMKSTVVPNTSNTQSTEIKNYISYSVICSVETLQLCR